jgi:mannitol-1-phosphate/altronate dehydrogenase
MRFLLRRDERGGMFAINDPLAGKLAAPVAKAGDNPAALATALLGVSEIFDPALSNNTEFRGHVIAALDVMLKRGVRAALME